MATVRQLSPGVGDRPDHPDTYVCVTCFARITKELKRFAAMHE